MSAQWKKQLAFIKNDLGTQTMLSVKDLVNMEEGRDYINLQYNSKNELGKFLSLPFYRTIIHPVFGKFRSVQGFWWYLKSEERTDLLRVLSFYDIMRLSKTLQTRRRVPFFEAAIIQATWLKVDTSVSLSHALKNYDGYFDCFYYQKVGDNKFMPIRLKYAKWYIDGINYIRECLREGIEPNFEPWLDGHTLEEMYEAQLEGYTIIKESENKSSEIIIEDDADDVDMPKENVI